LELDVPRGDKSSWFYTAGLGYCRKLLRKKEKRDSTGKEYKTYKGRLPSNGISLGQEAQTLEVKPKVLQQSSRFLPASVINRKAALLYPCHHQRVSRLQNMITLKLWEQYLHNDQ
jgi:hypothetical protein